MEETICAISTPLGKGAISIVRMSGKDSLKIMYVYPELLSMTKKQVIAAIALA